MKLKNPKRKGSRLELRAIAELKECGFLCVKSGGSFGPFDIIAVPDPSKVKYCSRAIQVKANRDVSYEERARIENASLPEYFNKEIWVWKDREGWKKQIVESGPATLVFGMKKEFENARS